MGTIVGRPCRFLGEGAMKPRNMNVVVGGKRYRTETATLLASGPSGKEHLGQTGAEPEPILEVRLGGVELGALLLRGNWERLGRYAFLFRTPKGNYFVQHQSSMVLLQISGELFAHSRPAISNWTGLWYPSVEWRRIGL